MLPWSAADSPAVRAATSTTLNIALSLLSLLSGQTMLKESGAVINRNRRREVPDAWCRVLGVAHPPVVPSLPAAAAEHHPRGHRPDDAEQAGPEHVEPVIPGDVAGQRGVQHPRAVVLQGQPRQAEDVVLLTDEQHQRDGHQVTHGPEAGAALGAGEAGDGQPDAHRPDGTD